MRSTPCPNHPNRQVHARGVCRACYDKVLRQENPGYAERQRANCRAWVKKHTSRSAAMKQQWRLKKGPEYQRYRLLKRYGLTPEDYEQLLAAQGGACAICRKPPKVGKPLNVDHCHATGAVRGLLCFRCNFGMSFFGEDPATLERAAAHLRGVPGERPGGRS